jgi:hypothetical protein
MIYLKMQFRIKGLHVEGYVKTRIMTVFLPNTSQNFTGSADLLGSARVEAFLPGFDPLIACLSGYFTSR